MTPDDGEGVEEAELLNDPRMRWFLLLSAVVMAVALNSEAQALTSAGPSSDAARIFSFGSFAIFLAFSVWFVQSRSAGPYLGAIFGVAAWASFPGLLGFTLADETASGREWWATSWYWAFKPLPVDFEGPTGWVPAVGQPDGVGQAAFIGIQAATVLILLAALGLDIKAWRDSLGGGG